jgi:hypothetical protein
VTLIVAVAADDHCCVASADLDVAEGHPPAAPALWAHPLLPLLVGIEGPMEPRSLDATLGELRRVPRDAAELLDALRPALEAHVRSKTALTLLAVGHVPGEMPMFAVARVGPSADDAAAFDVQSHFARSRNAAVLNTPDGLKQTPAYVNAVKLSGQPKERVHDVLQAFFAAAHATRSQRATPPAPGVDWHVAVRPA